MIDKIAICKLCLMPLSDNEIKLDLYVSMFNFFEGHKTIHPICYTCYNKCAGNVGKSHYIGVDKVKEIFK